MCCKYPARRVLSVSNAPAGALSSRWTARPAEQRVPPTRLVASRHCSLLVGRTLDWSVQRAMRECPAVPARPLLWGCPQTESGPANAVSEPAALSPPVIQSTASHPSHTALPGLQPSRVPLAPLSQRASLIRSGRRALALLLSVILPSGAAVRRRDADIITTLLCVDSPVCSRSDWCCPRAHRPELL